MSSILTSSEAGDYSKYSAFDDVGTNTLGTNTLEDSTSFAIRSKSAAGSLSLSDANFDGHHVKRRKQQQRAYSRDEFLYALSSPSSIGAIAWIVSSFMAVIYASSTVVYLNFCIPLLVTPYIINEQMPAQLFTSAKRKFMKLRSEANELVVKNIQLKGTVSRLQRQEYRLSVAEGRFEDLCKRNEKDVVKMKQLARKNADYKQQLKVNLAAKKLQRQLTDMLTADLNGNCLTSEKQIREVVMLMKGFAGKSATSKFDEDAIHRAVVNSMANNMKMTFVSTADLDNETRDSEGDYYDDRNTEKATKEEYRYSNDDEESEDLFTENTEPSFDGNSNGDESSEWPVSKTNNSASVSLKLDPSCDRADHQHRGNKTGSKMPSGTIESPIDIEKLLVESYSAPTRPAE